MSAATAAMTTAAVVAATPAMATAATATDRSALTITMHIPAVVVTIMTVIATTNKHIRLRHHHRPAAITAIHITDTAGQGQ